MMMNAESKPESEHRLERIAQDRSRPLAESVEEAMLADLDPSERGASTWVKATQGLLSKAWPADFKDWMPLISR
jgi:hypothetical protein